MSVRPIEMTRRMFGTEGAASWERGARSPSNAYAARSCMLTTLDCMIDAYGEKDPRVIELMELLAEWSDTWDPPIDRSVVIPNGYRHARMTMSPGSCASIPAMATQIVTYTPFGPFTPYALFLPRSYAPYVMIGIQAARRNCGENMPGELFARPGGRRIECSAVYPSIPLQISVTNRSVAAIPPFMGVVDGYEPMEDNF